MLRFVKMVLIAAVAAFGFIGGIFNLVNWRNTVAEVGRVTSMGSWPGGASNWQAVGSAPLSYLGAAGS
jgi:predicted small integral membrane protein